MHRDQGLPAAELQARIVDPAGFVARVDFLWRAQRTVGEADGRGGYDDRHALWAEKRREDRLREMGLEVVRWGWGDLSQPWVTARRIREAFARARARTG
jgi:very-short-patch-repair endonuclease